MHKNIGNKAKALVELKSAGFNIPSFLSFDCSEKFEEVERQTRLTYQPKQLLAIRSSSTLEDKKEKSYAGAFMTELGIQLDDLKESWIKVKDSLPVGNEGGIVIQEFIPGEYSGVAFIDSNMKRASINALPGLCKAVVEGWDCEHYNFFEEKILERKTKESYHGLHFENKEIIKKHSTYTERSEIILDVFQLAKKVEEHFGVPQDIEWTYHNGELYLLQSRPISRSPWHDSLENMYFDSANVGESYGGIICPLTSSFVRRLYDILYIDLLRNSGVEKRKLERNRKIFENLVSLVYGRLYYRMDNWYRMMAMLPGYERNKKNLEHMLSLNLREQVNVTEFQPSLFLRLIYVPRVIWKFLFFNRTMRRFNMELKTMIKDSKNWSLENFSTVECQKKIQFIFNNHLRKAYLTVENDTIMMTLFATLSKNKSNEDMMDLLNFPSASSEQVNALTQLSRSLCDNTKIKNSLNKKDRLTFMELLKIFPNLRKQYIDYLELYGGRFANELKLETPDINEDFGTFSDLVLAYASKKTKNLVRKPNNDNYLEKLFKKFATRREEFRLLRANMFAIIRRLVLRIADQWVAEGYIKDRNDIFFMDWGHVCGENPQNQIDTSKIDYYKKEYDFFKSFDPPAFFIVKNGHWPTLTNKQSQKENIGIGASFGQATGRAIVLKEFSIPDPDSYEILVTKRTDPGWTAIMALSQGIVVEHGGILSHASIVARELGIPAVIGVKGACSKYISGDLLYVDGDKGMVHRIKN